MFAYVGRYLYVLICAISGMQGAQHLSSLYCLSSFSCNNEHKIRKYCRNHYNTLPWHTGIILITRNYFVFHP